MSDAFNTRCPETAAASTMIWYFFLSLRLPSVTLFARVALHKNFVNDFVHVYSTVHIILSGAIIIAHSIEGIHISVCGAESHFSRQIHFFVIDNCSAAAHENGMGSTLKNENPSP